MAQSDAFNDALRLFKGKRAAFSCRCHHPQCSLSSREEGILVHLSISFSLSLCLMIHFPSASSVSNAESTLIVTRFSPLILSFSSEPFDIILSGDLPLFCTLFISSNILEDSSFPTYFGYSVVAAKYFTLF